MNAANPRVVCLSGSLRFIDTILATAGQEEAAGRVALVPFLSGVDQDTADRLHDAKIRLADELLVVNPGGYVGESTAREIAYTEALGKPVRYLEPKAVSE